MRVLLTGAGGPASIGVARSLRLEDHYLAGVDCSRYGLPFAPVNARELIPRADEPGYPAALCAIIRERAIDFVHAQPDAEVRVISEYRDSLGARTLLPKHETVVLCQDKYATNRRLLGTGVPIPKTIPLSAPADLLAAPRVLGEEFWIRDRAGAAGRGAWHVKPGRREEALAWVSHNDGWGRYIASEYLPGRLVTWQSVWKNGKLVCAQGRERLEWALANRSPSGVTGITGVARTIGREDVADVGRRCVLALDSHPDGIFGVDMKEDASGAPRVTEVNIGRFFTTIEFFTQMGLNMPDLLVRAAFDRPTPWRPCEDGWYWLRSMDAEPRLLPPEEFE